MFVNKNSVGQIINGFTLIENLCVKKLRKNQKSLTVFLIQCNNCKFTFEQFPNKLRRSNNCMNCRGRSQGYSGLLRLFGDYKRSAKKRKIEFNLTLEQFQILTSNNCHYCGNHPSNKRKGGGNYIRKDGKINDWFIYTYNGIDRINTKSNYNIWNCVPACTICNHAKTNLSYEEFIEWIKKLKIHQSIPM